MAASTVDHLARDVERADAGGAGGDHPGQPAYAAADVEHDVGGVDLHIEELE